MEVRLPDADPVRSKRRLAAVDATRLLDTPPERAFDDLTRMAALLVNAPYAFATLVDESRSFWKSCFGIPADGPRQNTVEESFCQYVIRNETAVIINDAANDERTRANPSVTTMGVRAWAGFPLLAPNGEVLGSFCIVDTVPRVWSERDIEVIETLAKASSREIALRAAIQDERFARRGAEILAQTLGQSLLPPQLPDVPGLDLGVRFHPAGQGIELAGDFYDVFATGNGSWSFIVGDVCGKGVEAAQVAAFARHTVGALAMQAADPAHVLAWLNATFVARNPNPGVFLTAVYGTVSTDANGAAVRFACAGHPPPILRRADGTTEIVDAHGTLIGGFPERSYDEVSLRLGFGDALIIMTDGVLEARRGKVFIDEAAIFDLIATADHHGAAALADRIAQAALAFGGAVAADDIAVLVMIPIPAVT